MRILPIGWKEVSLGEICEFKYGRSLPNGQRKSGNMPVFGSNGMVGYHNQGYTSGPTIIIGRKGSFGEVNFSPSSCWPIDTTYYIDSTATKEDLRWLTYRLSELGLTKLNRAAAIPGLNRDDAYRQRFLLPPLSEQKRIAAILEKADAIRRKRQTAIKLTDGFLRATFLDMFGDPVINPKGFKIIKLGNVCNKITDGTHDTPKRLRAGMPFITGKHIRPFLIDFKNCDYVSSEDHEEIIKRCKPERGDVLYTNIGANVGTAAVNTWENTFSMKNVALLKPNRKTISSRYLEFALNHGGMKNKILGSSSVGGAQQFLSLTQIKQVEIPVPMLPIQEKFEGILKKASMLIEQHNKILLENNHLLNSITQRAFRGEL